MDGYPRNGLLPYFLLVVEHSKKQQQPKQMPLLFPWKTLQHKAI